MILLTTVALTAFGNGAAAVFVVGGILAVYCAMGAASSVRR